LRSGYPYPVGYSIHSLYLTGNASRGYDIQAIYDTLFEWLPDIYWTTATLRLDDSRFFLIRNNCLDPTLSVILITE